MFKETFNSLYVAINAFILNTKKINTFNHVSDEIQYYHDMIDEYNTLVFNIKQLQMQLTSTNPLLSEINTQIDSLENVKQYIIDQSPIIVNSYFTELNNSSNKLLFVEKLYRFEQSLVATPINKIDNEALQELMNVAKEYFVNTKNYYYYSNNPFELNTTLGIIVPVKYTFDSMDKLLTSLYGYLNTIYNHYLYVNKKELSALINLEKNIHEMIFEYQGLLNNYKKDRIIVDNTTTSMDYYNSIKLIETALITKKQTVINAGVYRFTSLVSFFETINNATDTFLTSYQSNELYTTYDSVVEYNSKIKLFHDYISLLENGTINVEIDYILADVDFKVLVDEIINLSRVINQPIYYTQKYSLEGIAKDLIFEFYQTDLFLDSVKTYYYQLMTQNLFRYSNIDVSSFGDETINDLKTKYIQNLTNYQQYISRETEYMTPIEFNSYYDTVLSVQNKLKTIATLFFDAALKTSPSTYADTIDQTYSNFLETLKSDVSKLDQKKTSILLAIPNEEKNKAYINLNNISTHVQQIENILTLSHKYVFLGLSDKITSILYNPFNLFLNTLKTYFIQEKYTVLNTYYDDFFKNKLIDFNFLYALEHFAGKLSIIFDMIDSIDTVFIDMHISKSYNTKYDSTISMLNDLFDDETYKVSRNEIFASLDLLYEFIIKKDSPNKTFFINEKNIKKVYFDNQFIKINYIRWYHKLFLANTKFDVINLDLVQQNSWYLTNKDSFNIIVDFGKLETLILNQNKNLALISKALNDYSLDTNFVNINVSSDTIKNIDQFNNSTDYIKQYIINVDKLDRVEQYENINERNKTLLVEHKSEWVDMIVNNNIPGIEQISYNELDPITGSIPLTVEFNVKLENSIDASGNIIESEYFWYFDDSVVQQGNKITHTFYKEGKHIVRCEIKYATGEVASKYIEFDLTGPQNSQIVKSGTLNYSPLSVYVDQPKITYIDPKTQKTITVPINITGDITKLLDGASVAVDTLTDDLKEEKAGLIIFGFNGSEISGTPYDYTKIYSSDFSFPTEHEFLFDFNISTPVAGISNISISLSKFTTFMAKLPNSINSPYEVSKASLFETAGKNIDIIVGDKLIFKNVSDRYALIDILDIKVITDSTTNKYYYEISMDYFVNVSLNQYDKDVFKPNSTNLTVPTIVFKNDVRDIFNSLITRLESMKLIKDKMSSTNDTETKKVLEMELNTMSEENKKFYLFSELDRIKSRNNSLTQYYNNLEKKFTFDFSNEISVIDQSLDAYKNHIENTKTFEEYLNSTNAYEFKKNLIDLKTILEISKDQETILETLIMTYEYNSYDKDFFNNRLSLVTSFGILKIDTTLSYGLFLVEVVSKLRELFFKIKLIINFPILSNDSKILLTSDYLRLVHDEMTGVWSMQPDSDFYMFNKKLELKYGYEIDKIENKKPYKTFIGDIASKIKSVFGQGLSNDDINGLSLYIQTLEQQVISEYDDYFMVSFWVDYIKKNIK